MPPRLSLPSLARQCRSLLAQQPAAAAAARLISTTAPKAAPGSSSSTFSPAKLLEGLDKPDPSSGGPSRSPLPGLKTSSNFWSMGGNRSARGRSPAGDPAASSPSTASVIENLTGMLKDPSTREAHRTLRKAQTKAEASALVRREHQSDAYMRQMPRRWATGEVYAPHDLSPEEVKRYFRRELKPRFDVFDVLGFNPLDNYANFSVISEYMTPMGRIKHRDETGLRPVNHRKMAKAIRRAIGLGLHPSTHRHPEILHRLRRSQPGRAKFD